MNIGNYELKIYITYILSTEINEVYIYQFLHILIAYQDLHAINERIIIRISIK